MDSLTHIVIGAAIGELVLGNKIGRKAAAIGALAKTIPDFDLFYTGLNDPFMYICHHRGHTHSLLWETLYAIPIAYLFYRLFSKSISFSRWIFLFLVCLWGHSLLDLCTNYGTRLFLPITNNAYALNNISIVDLIFTLPMLVMLIISLVYKNGSEKRRFFAKTVLLYCFMYLTYTCGNKIYANHLFDKSLQKSNIQYEKRMSNPTILNNFLWYAIAVNDSNLFITENSILFPMKDLKWTRYKRNTNYLENYPDKTKANTLKWFSKGYNVTERRGDTFNVYVAKFGRTNMNETDAEKSFVFHYKLFYEDGKSMMTMIEPSEKNSDISDAFRDLIDKILGN